jgi:hypothetical protein
VGVVLQLQCLPSGVSVSVITMACSKHWQIGHLLLSLVLATPEAQYGSWLGSNPS